MISQPRNIVSVLKLSQMGTICEKTLTDERYVTMLFAFGLRRCFWQKQLGERESLLQVTEFMLSPTSYFQKHIQNFCSSEDNKYKIKCTHNYCKSCWCSAVSTCVGYSGEKVLLVNRQKQQLFLSQKGRTSGLRSFIDTEESAKAASLNYNK